MSDKREPYMFKFEVEIDGFERLTFETSSKLEGLAVEVVDREDDGLHEWFREVVAAGSKEAEPYKRDLIMRETELEPGLRDDNPDEPLEQTLVATCDGTRRLFRWCDRGQADELAQPGDIVLRGVYPMAYRRGPVETDDDAVVEGVELDFQDPT